MKKQDVAKILGISKPTLDKIIKDKRIILDDITLKNMIYTKIEMYQIEIKRLREYLK